MHITGKGRDAFLDFLRNLTPQAFLGASSIVVLSFIRKPWDRWENYGFGLLALSLVAIVLLAASANMSRFLDNAFSESTWGRRTLRVIKARESSAWKQAYLFLEATWQRRRVMFVEFVVAVSIIYLSVFAVIVMATRTALSAIRNS
jgi:hypothetical protein